MNYQEKYAYMQRIIARSNESVIDLPTKLPLTLTRHSFRSPGAIVLPGVEKYDCHHHRAFFEEPFSLANPMQEIGGIISSLHQPDFAIQANKQFQYLLIQPKTPEGRKEVIFLFHGLNERKWDKYLPWATTLAENTGKSVLLFPLAFHMDRAPAEWSEARLMQAVAQGRKKKYPTLSGSSFVNAAMSTRLQSLPERFFWSGLQTYLDIVNLIASIRKGQHSHLEAQVQIDLFGYSIGAFFSLILLMGNPEQFFSESKLFIFCGGTCMDRMYPTSREILDSKAAITIHSYFQEQLESDFLYEKRLHHFLSEWHPEESYFKTMVAYYHFKDKREKKLRELQHRLKAVVLNRDEVIPPQEVIHTLKGGFGNIGADVQVIDFPYAYSHSNPFPARTNESALVDLHFHRLMDEISLFYK
jgi:hypothetical protein